MDGEARAAEVCQVKACHAYKGGSQLREGQAGHNMVLAVQEVLPLLERAASTGAVHVLAGGVVLSMRLELVVVGESWTALQHGGTFVTTRAWEHTQL